MDEKKKELEYDPEVKLLQWPKARDGYPNERSWNIMVRAHENGKLIVTVPKEAYDIIPMSQEELDYLMTSLEHLPAIFAMLLGLTKEKEQ